MFGLQYRQVGTNKWFLYDSEYCLKAEAVGEMEFLKECEQSDPDNFTACEYRIIEYALYSDGKKSDACRIVE